MGRGAAVGAVFVAALGCGRLDFSAVRRDAGPETDAGRETDAGGAIDAGGVDGAGDAQWWDADFAHRIRLDLNRAPPTEALVDFPLLVVLDASRFDRSLARDDLADLRFVTDAGELLDHELETTASTVFAWVRVPRIETGESPVLWLYFGSPTATVRTGTVFGDEYPAVFHLADATDATAHGNDGTPVGGASFAEGKIAGAVTLPAGRTAAVRVDDDPSLHWGAQVTVSGWIDLRSYQEMCSCMVARQRVENDAWNDFFVGVCSRVAHGQVFPRLLNATAGVPLDAWTQLTFVYDSMQLTLYVNGVEAASAMIMVPMGSADRPIYIGGDRNIATGGPSNSMTNGAVDEIRITALARSSAFIAADYASMNDALITYGPVEP